MEETYDDYQREIISRKESKSRGLKKYFTGMPCINGHIDYRHTNDGKCYECRKIYDRKRQDYFKDWQKRNPEKVRQYSRDYIKRNPGKGAKYMAKLRAEHRDEMLAYERSLYAANREKFLEKGRKYRQENPDIYAHHARKRRAIQKGAEGYHSKEEITDLLIKQKFKCANCLTNIKKNHHADHILPLVRGGSNSITNIQMLCRSCNSKKGTKDAFEFAQLQGRLL